MTHGEILTDVQLAISAAGFRAWRNPVGFWIDPHGNRIHYGLAKGSADLIGIGPGGRFLSYEIKVPGDEPKRHQWAWHDMVLERGGIAGIIHDRAEALALLR